MERNEMIDILNGMCERCLMKGMISTLDGAKTLCDTFDRFKNKKYKNDEEYSKDILYLYDLAMNLHGSGHTSLGESYSIYSALLEADKVDFVETNEPIEEDIIVVEPVKLKRGKKNKSTEGVVEISDITIS